MNRSRALLLGGTLAIFALAPAATAAAGPPASLLSAGSPPAAAVAGQAFTLKGKVRNKANRSARARLTVTLRKTRSAKDGRIVAAKFLKRTKAKRTLAYKVRVRIPASLAAGPLPRRHVRARGQPEGQLPVRQAQADGPRGDALGRARARRHRRAGSRCRREASGTGRRGRPHAAGLRLRRRDPPAGLGADRVRLGR